MSGLYPREGVLGVLLAGGLARRMGGGDKCLMRLGAGETLLERAIATLRPQVGPLILNANGDPGRFAAFDLPVVADTLPDFAGPLAGVLTGMEWAIANAPDVAWVVTAPTDAPFLPDDLVARLMEARAERHAEVACAHSGGRDHPVAALWPVELAKELRAAMLEEGLRKIDLFTARHNLVRAEWSAEPLDPFFNANRPEDLREAERLLATTP